MMQLQPPCAVLCCDDARLSGAHCGSIPAAFGWQGRHASGGRQAPCGHRHELRGHVQKRVVAVRALT